MLCGGFSECTGENLTEAQNLFTQHSTEVAGKLKADSSAIKFESAMSQVVAGLNYRIFFTIDGKKYSTTIWRKLDGTAEVTDVSEE